MKTLLISLLLTAHLPILANGSGHIREYQAIRLTSEYTSYTLGEAITIEEHLSFHPAGFSKYQIEPLEHFGWWCKADSGKFERLYFPSTPVPAYPTMQYMKLPIIIDSTGGGLPAYKAGALECFMKGAYYLLSNERKKIPFTIKSNVIKVIVRQPTIEDEKVLKEAGLYEQYMTGQLTLKTVNSMVPYKKYPASSYYCKPAVRELRHDFSNTGKWLATPDDWSKGELVWGPSPKWFAGVNEKINNLENCKDSEATPSDVVYWRVLANLLNGDFKAAQVAAKPGLEKESSGPRKVFYERLIAFHNEDEFLSKFKSVRRKPPN